MMLRVSAMLAFVLAAAAFPAASSFLACMEGATRMGIFKYTCRGKNSHITHITVTQ